MGRRHHGSLCAEMYDLTKPIGGHYPDVPYYRQRLAAIGEREVIGRGPAIEGFAEGLHSFRHRKVAHTHLAQIVVHIVAKMVEQRDLFYPLRRSSTGEVTWRMSVVTQFGYQLTDIGV